MKRLKRWLRKVRVQKAKKYLSKLPPSEQLGIAVGVIGSIAVNHPRHERRKFLSNTMSLMDELIKTQTIKKGDKI